LGLSDYRAGCLDKSLELFGTIVKLKIFNSEFLGNVSYQVIGTGIAQGLPFAISPILTRLYAEQDFALFTSFFAIVNILVVGAGGRYQFAIVLPRKDTEAKDIFDLSVFITVVYSILILLSSMIIDLYFHHQLGLSIYFIPLYILLFGVWNSFSYLSVRHKTFFHNATAKVVQSVVYVTTSVVLGWLKLTHFGLIMGRLLGLTASWIYLQKKSVNVLKFGEIGKLKSVAKAYVDYPKYGLLPAFLDIASVQGIVLIIARFYQTSDLGYFGLTALVLSAPIGLIGGSFKDVFYERITSLIIDKSFQQARDLFLKSALGLFALGAPICLTIYLYGPDIFKFIFGHRWERSGYFASILSLSFLIQLVVSPLSSIFNAANKLKVASVWQTLYFITTFLTLGITSIVLNMSVEDLLRVYVIHETILYLIYFILQYRTLNRLI
jgi:O-antigen/teichoic acid export membrane protein